MREIKFRAFYENKMYQVRGIRFEANEVCLWNGRGTEFNFIDTSKVNLMQFAGRKDKNGVEIYEGDIIKINTFYHNIVPINYHYKHESDKGEAYYEVFFRKENLAYEMRLIHFTKQEPHRFLTIHSGHVVFSNIHENPQLLATYEKKLKK